jgi:hypothetical protein
MRNDLPGAGLGLGWIENPMGRNVTIHACPKVPVCRVDNDYLVTRHIYGVIGYHNQTIMKMDMPVKVVKDEESAKEEPSPPEGMRDPGV